jgi:DNA-binding NarL/FixJ family response regulator
VHNEPELVERGHEAGAFGYVVKSAAAHDLVSAVHAALRGERYVSSREQSERETNDDGPRSSDPNGRRP